MFCKNCGTELPEGAAFCTACGAALEEKEPVSLNPAADKILAVLRDKKFLVLLISLSIYCLLTLSFGSLPLIHILAAIFLWLSFAQGQKGVVHAEHLRCVSGTVYANYVITNVACGIIAVCGALSGVLMILFGDAAEFVDSFSSAFNEVAVFPTELLGLGIRVLGVFFLAIFLLVAAGIFAVNYFGMRRFHRFAKSVYQSVDNNTLDFCEPTAVRNWLIAFTVFSGLSFVLGISGGIESVINQAALFVANLMATLLVKQHFKEEQQMYL